MLQITNATVTMTSLELVDTQIEELLSSPTKDYEWYCRAFEYVDTSALKNHRSVQKAILVMISALFREYKEQEEAAGKVANTLYIMESPAMGAVKIGRTWNDVHKRSSQLRTGCPDIRVAAVFENQGMLEAVIHRRLSCFCVGGEWFSLSASAAALIIQEEIDSRFK